MDNIFTKLGDHGILGIVCVVLLIAVGSLWKRLSEIQDARFQDMKENNNQLITLARDLDGTLNALKSVVEGIRRV